jgi:adenylylsulfate kinase-like enzyme
MLIIIRGLPGSGKSTLAGMMSYHLNVKDGKNCQVFEADQYFTDANGNYHFDGTKLREAHDSCKERTRAWLTQRGYNVAIVSNTFTQRWEYQPYLDMAKKLDVPVQVIEVHGNFGNIHGVPPEKIESMRKRWEPHV